MSGKKDEPRDTRGSLAQVSLKGLPDKKPPLLSENESGGSMSRIPQPPPLWFMIASKVLLVSKNASFWICSFLKNALFWIVKILFYASFRTASENLGTGRADPPRPALSLPFLITHIRSGLPKPIFQSGRLEKYHSSGLFSNRNIQLQERSS